MQENTTFADEDGFEEMNIRVDPGQTPLRIDRFLLDRLNRISRNKIQNGVRFGLITVNGKTVKPNYKVRPNDDLRVVIPRFAGSGDGVAAEDIPLNIVFEDDSILVINKQTGLVVHPGIGNHSGTLVNGLKFYLSKQDLPVKEGNLNDRPGLVHRIDKDTSGLLVIAKTEEAMAHLSKQFYDHTVERRYRALVWGNLSETEGTIVGYLGRNPKNRLQMMVFPDEDKGKHAITHYRVLEDLYYVSWIECQLETGRTHQIRAHMKYAGHPLFNDARYGGDRILKGTVFSKYKQFVHNCFTACPRQVLHAGILGFVHPVSGESMHFEAELPEDISNLLDKWKHYLRHKKEEVGE